MPAWQPIETAPKDGTWVLLRGGVVDDFDDYAVGPVPEPAAIVARWIGEENASYECNVWGIALWDGDWRTQYSGPTHWMQIPE
jgi:hypothetical protein